MTDYPQEDQALVSKLGLTLNQSLESIYNMSANNVTLGDNVNCTVKTITAIVDSTGKPTGSGTSSFLINTTQQISGITVIKVVNSTSTTVYPTGQPFISYSQNSSTITINNIAGLPANNTFQLTLIAWNG